jgi:hypothetical protein
MTCFRGLTVTLCKRYQYVLIKLSLESNPTQVFVQLYCARASTLLTSAFDHFLVFTYPGFIKIAFHTYSLSLTQYYTKLLTFCFMKTGMPWPSENERNQNVVMLRAGKSVYESVAVHFVCKQFATWLLCMPLLGLLQTMSFRDDRFITLTHLRNRFTLATVIALRLWISAQALDNWTLTSFRVSFADGSVKSLQARNQMLPAGTRQFWLW